MVAGAGEHRIQRHLPGDAVVAVPGQVLAVGFRAEHRLGAQLANLPHQFLAEIGLVFQKAVFPLQQHQFLHAQRAGRRRLFLLPEGAQFGGAGRGSGAFAAVSAKHIAHLGAGAQPPGYAAGAPVFGIAGVRNHHQNPLRRCVHRPVSSRIVKLPGLNPPPPYRNRVNARRRLLSLNYSATIAPQCQGRPALPGRNRPRHPTESANRQSTDSA